MPLKIEIDNHFYSSIGEPVYSEDDETFILNFPPPIYEIKVDYLLEPKTEIDHNNYTLFLFKNNFYAENHIYQVYESELDERLGWMFPIQAINSKSHSFTDNQFFLNYAFAAIKILLIGSNLTRSNSSKFNRDNYSVLDFYEDDDILLVLSNQKIAKIENFSIDNFIPCLFKFGYHLVTSSKSGENIFHSQNQFYDQLSTRIVLKPISKCLQSELYVNNLFKKFLPYEQHHLVRFSVLYQIVEWLIEKIFQKELLSRIGDYRCRAPNDTIEFYELKESIIELTNEKKRINKLFSNYANIAASCHDLKRKCDILLNALGKEQNDSITHSLYRIRNILYHGYRNLNDVMVEMVEEINREFEIVIVELVINYSEDN